jgi:hypothetical protein
MMSKSGTSQNRGQKRQLRQKVVADKLKRQSGKERTKVAKELHKLQQLGAGDLNPHIQQLRLESKNTRDGLNGLIQAFNTNFQSYGGAMQQLDARLGAMALVVDDLVECLASAGTPLPELTVLKNEAGRTSVHWEAYIKHYIDNVRAELLMRAEAAAKEEQVGAIPGGEEPATLDPLFTPETPEESTHTDVVFGGDTDGQTST